MKALVTAVALTALTAAPSFAGGMAEPLMEPEVIAEETTDSGGFIIPLIILAVIVAAISSGGGGSTPTGETLVVR